MNVQQRNVSRVMVQQNGLIMLPPTLRQEFGLKRGDAVTFVRRDGGWWIAKEEVDPMALFDQIGEILHEKGVTLDEMLADGQVIRAELTEELYGAVLADDD